MTAFNKTQLPDSIETLEELAAWCGLALNNINPAQTAIEGLNVNQRTSQVGIFYIEVDNKHRMLIRLSLPVDPNYLAGGSKTWNYVQALSATEIPAIFTSDASS